MMVLTPSEEEEEEEEEEESDLGVSNSRVLLC
jgi:hypothetical protein